GCRLPHAPHPGRAQELEEPLEDFRGRRGVGERPVVRGLAHPEVVDERAQTV
ncbi:MAG: hypothetical protein AVDCRST_MAG12-3315, partial [uncultured Rubrobacteraceae bacterium]